MVTHDQDVRETLRKGFHKHDVSDVDLIDSADHGSDSGSGLVYYTETSEFYDDYEDELWELMGQAAEDIGAKSVMEFMSKFKIADQIADDSTFRNAIVWFAQEEVGAWIRDTKGVEAEETMEGEEEEEEEEEAED